VGELAWILSGQGPGIAAGAIGATLYWIGFFVYFSRP
jgi:hypothetical protein